MLELAAACYHHLVCSSDTSACYLHMCVRVTHRRAISILCVRVTHRRAIIYHRHIGMIASWCLCSSDTSACYHLSQTHRHVIIRATCNYEMCDVWHEWQCCLQARFKIHIALFCSCMLHWLSSSCVFERHIGLLSPSCVGSSESEWTSACYLHMCVRVTHRHAISILCVRVSLSDT